MTAKEKLLERVAELSESIKSSACSALARVHSLRLAILPARFRVRRRRADETLRLLDSVIRRFEDAPLEDEEISAEEEAAVQEARDELAAGAPTISHEEIKRELVALAPLSPARR